MNLSIDKSEPTFPGMLIGIIGSHFVACVWEFPSDLAFQPVKGARDGVLSSVTTTAETGVSVAVAQEGWKVSQRLGNGLY